MLAGVGHTQGSARMRCTSAPEGAGAASALAVSRGSGSAPRRRATGRRCQWPSCPCRGRPGRIPQASKQESFLPLASQGGGLCLEGAGAIQPPRATRLAAGEGWAVAVRVGALDRGTGWLWLPPGGPGGIQRESSPQGHGLCSTVMTTPPTETRGGQSPRQPACALM